jgi:hypothetical protein
MAAWNADSMNSPKERAKASESLLSKCCHPVLSNGVESASGEFALKYQIQKGRSIQKVTGGPYDSGARSRVCCKRMHMLISARYALEVHTFV